MFGVTPITPAYGRDYKSKKAMQADLDAGKDFQTPSGRYAGISELRAMGLRKVQARYDRLTKSAVLTIKED